MLRYLSSFGVHVKKRSRAPPTYPLYILTEVVKSYPVINELELQSGQESAQEPEIFSIPTFSYYMAQKGANSFLVETPHYTKGYSLAQRIEMNLIATDRILARHYLGI